MNSIGFANGKSCINRLLQYLKQCSWLLNTLLTVVFGVMVIRRGGGMANLTNWPTDQVTVGRRPARRSLNSNLLAKKCLRTSITGLRCASTKKDWPVDSLCKYQFSHCQLLCKLPRFSPPPTYSHHLPVPHSRVVNPFLFSACKTQFNMNSINKCLSLFRCISICDRSLYIFRCIY